MTRAQPRRVRWSLATAVAVAAALMLAPGVARADHTQITILEDNPLVLAHPTATLERLQALGVSTLRLSVPWAEIAPDPAGRTRPSFDATDPAAYPRTAWAVWDAVILAAHQVRINVDLDLAPGAPRWATGSGQPSHVTGYPWWQWEPNAVEFGRFAQAVGERYSGNWDPVTDRLAPGDPADLPRVSFWSIWNEPDYGPSLAPQALPGHPGVEDSPRMYRELVDHAWTGLAHSGHTVPGDTILIGELAPRSQLTEPGRFTDFNGMTPMVFLENLYCLTPRFMPWRGASAALRGCPASRVGTRRFMTDNRALFDTSGISDHPYDEWFAPDQELDVPKLPGWALETTQDTSLATIGVLERGLNRLTAAYGDRQHLPIWDTEYGYQTSPPHRLWSGDSRPWPSPGTAADYDNWAEYLHWKNPRLKSFAQYLLKDAAPATPANDFGSFASGLLSFDGVAKGDELSAFQMPLYLPRTTELRPDRGIEVWGDVRPASLRAVGLDQAQTVKLLFEPEGTHAWLALSTLAVSAGGYYDADVRFPSSGTLRAEWTEPAAGSPWLTGATLASRAVTVTVRSR